jgi:hypothetical protein
MIQMIKEAEIAESQKLTGYLTLIRLLFQINSTSIYNASGYAYVLQKSNFMWLKKRLLGQHQSFNLSSAFECD